MIVNAVKKSKKKYTTRKVQYSLSRVPDSSKEIARYIVDENVLKLCDIDNPNVKQRDHPLPHTYGLFTPGYILLSEIGSHDKLVNYLCEQMALKLLYYDVDFDIIAATALGGIVLGFQLKRYLQKIFEKEILFLEIRKQEDVVHDEDLIIGDYGNERIIHEMRVNIFDEVADSFKTTIRAANICRSDRKKYVVTTSSHIISYNNPLGLRCMKQCGIEPHYLTTVADVICAANESKKYDPRLINQYREFINGRYLWNENHGLGTIDMFSYKPI